MRHIHRRKRCWPCVLHLFQKTVFPLLIFIPIFAINQTLCQMNDKKCENLTIPLIYINRRSPYTSLSRPNLKLAVEPPITSVERNQLAVHNIRCEFNRPIHWVFDFNPFLTSVETTSNFFERQWKSNTTFSYSIDFGFLHVKFLNLLLACEPVEPIILPRPCETTDSQPTANYLQIRSVHASGIPEYKVTSNPEGQVPVKLTPMSFSLESTSSVQEYFDETTDWNACRFRLYVKSSFIEEKDIPKLKYKWETNGSGRESIIEEVYTTNRSITYENMFRSVRMSPGCTKVIGKDETCRGCKLVSNYTVNAVIFYAESRDETYSIVAKGLYSVRQWLKPSSRTFYFQWHVPITEMMSIQSVPEIVYVNQTIKVSCNVSTFYFAFGTVLTTGVKPENVTEGHVEIFHEDGVREISKDFYITEEKTQITFTCFAPLIRSESWVNLSQTSLVEYPIFPKINGVEESTVETIVGEVNAVNSTISCQATGNPLPSIRWDLPLANLSSRIIIQTINTTDGANVDNTNNVVSSITFPILNTTFTGTYTCTAENYLGKVSKAFSITLPVTGVSKTTEIALSSSLGTLALLVIITIIVMSVKIKNQRERFRTETQQAIKEFKEGIKQKRMENEARKTKAISSKDEIELKNSPHESILTLPYNDAYEVPLKNWAIDDKILGSGQFGVVKKGLVNTGKCLESVAVKSMKNDVEINDFKSFLFELKIMAFIGTHENVVSLVASCTDNINNRSILIGVEYCSNGSLLDYLRSNRSLFSNYVDDGKISEDNFFNKGTYANRLNPVFSTIDLYKWAFQIANGMEFLEAKKVMHGDLAARNVLLTTDKIAKISDFGLSRLLLDSSNYTKKTACPLPWKWMAIESLESMQFSSQSDVWSYGVTLWELFSLGSSPWPGLHWDPEFTTQLHKGLRMNRPIRATENMYRLMLDCWHTDSEKRAKFSTIKSWLEEALHCFNASVYNELKDFDFARF